ncbi:MAG: stage V sporulation protein AC [Clostridia bacterium]|nr:stage V sporulation protein AC [Clostridia bacterium]
MSDISKKDYNKLSDSMAEKSPIIKNTAFAFLVGGLVCAIGQILLDFYSSLDVSDKVAGALVTVTLILFSAILTAIGVYDKIAKLAGAGTLVPVTGFANSIVSPAMEFVPEGYILGVGVKIFSIAGPVLTYGGLTSVICGLIYYFMRGMQ